MVSLRFFLLSVSFILARPLLLSVCRRGRLKVTPPSRQELADISTSSNCRCHGRISTFPTVRRYVLGARARCRRQRQHCDDYVGARDRTRRHRHRQATSRCWSRGSQLSLRTRHRASASYACPRGRGSLACRCSRLMDDAKIPRWYASMGSSPGESRPTNREQPGLCDGGDRSWPCSVRLG